MKTRVDTDKQILYRVTTVFPDGIGQSVTADDWTYIAEGNEIATTPDHRAKHHAPKKYDSRMQHDS